uniref:Nonaspanin n=1 Tax=Tanacetum cinerariifolium TaxID=118510 RepID=A0A6L2LZ78_TANCI|nr:nonaspanin [Tanacetum cinerariifolium]
MEFKADDYAVLVSHPAPFQKFPKPFLCLIRTSHNYTLDEDTYPTFLRDDGMVMDLLAFIHVSDPTKVKIGEREHAEGEAQLLDTTVGGVVPLLPVTPDRVDSELEASIKKLFDESGGADQGNSAGGGGQEAEDNIVASVRFVERENVAAEKLKLLRKKRHVVTDAGDSSHPLKKLRSDHGTLCGATTAGKSPASLKQLLASSLLNVKSGVKAVATLPFVTSSVSATPEHEGGVPADSITGTNVTRAKVDSIITSAVIPPVMSEAVITTHVASILSATAPEPGTKVITPVHASMFHDSKSIGMVRPDVAGSSHFLGKELSIGSREVGSESLYEIRDMDYDELFTEFSVGTARHACLSAEVRMWTEYCLRERKRLESKFEKQTGLLKSWDEEIKNLKAQLLLKEANSVEVARLHTRVSAFEAVEQVHIDELNTLKQKNVALEDEKESINGRVAKLESLVSIKDRELKYVDAIVTSLKSQNDGLEDQLEKFQDDRMKVVNDKFDQLHTDFVEMALHLEENAAINKAIEKGMQDGLSAGIAHGKEGRSLVDVTAHNPFTEADYVTALQRLQSVNFSLLAELKANKDASTETLFDLFHLEDSLTERLGLHELQPSFDQLMVTVHHSPDQTVVGATALSLTLDVSNIRVQNIRENIANRRSALRDVFVPEPFYSADLVGMEGTSNVVYDAVHTTTALSMTFASASTVPPITIEDYKFIGTGGPKGAQKSGEVSSFP